MGHLLGVSQTMREHLSLETMPVNAIKSGPWSRSLTGLL